MSQSSEVNLGNVIRVQGVVGESEFEDPTSLDQFPGDPLDQITTLSRFVDMLEEWEPSPPGPTAHQNGCI
jgi:hypothetical protein